MLTQFDAYQAQTEQILEQVTTTEAASATIAKLEAAGATRPQPLHQPQRTTTNTTRKARRPAKASQKQIQYALDLIDRDPAAFEDTDLGQAGAAPTERDLKRMSSGEVSHLIRDLKGGR